MSNTMRAVLGVLVVGLAVVLLVVLQDSGGDSEGDRGSVSSPAGKNSEGGGDAESQDAALAVPTVVVKNGAPVGGVRTLTYIEGDRIRFRVDSDVSDEVHIHGYDLSEDVEAGGSARFDFPADIEGIFEVELEGRGEQIAELRVNP